MKATPPDKSGVAQALLQTLNSVAPRVQTLWISFVSFGAYLTIIVLGTTHRMLFLEEPVRLPVFNIDLPLTSFYFIAPAFLLVFHFYFLVQLTLLARTADAFDQAVELLKIDDRNALRDNGSPPRAFAGRDLALHILAGLHPRSALLMMYVPGSGWLSRITSAAKTYYGGPVDDTGRAIFLVHRNVPKRTWLREFDRAFAPIVKAK